MACRNAYFLFLQKKVKKYTSVFFDLDRTLWDLEKNALLCLEEIYHENNLHDKGIPSFEAFHTVYKNINNLLWAAYRKDEIKKEKLRTERFKLSLQHFRISNDILANKMGDEYVNNSPKKTALFPHSKEILDYLSKKYSLFIITNGFKEVQYKKLQNAAIAKYFKHVFVSEEIGAMKPHPFIFKETLRLSNSSADNSIMIGDDFAVDILGAKAVGIDQIYFNPENEIQKESATYEIKSLKEIFDIL
jgi:putative hydrolase of the HAD superfamily